MTTERQRIREESRDRLRRAIERADGQSPVEPLAGAAGRDTTTKGEDMITAREIRERADAAQRAYEEGRSKLYRSDGEKRYSDAEHGERERAFRKERDEALKTLGDAANAERVKAESGAEAAQHQDLTAFLTLEELAAANARQVFVFEEVKGMREEQLLARLGSVLAKGDRVSIFLHARAVRKRGVEESRKRAEAAPKAEAKAGGGGASLRRSSLEAEATKLEDHLFGASRDREVEEAKKRAKEYLDAGHFVWRKKGGPYQPNYAVPRGA